MCSFLGTGGGAAVAVRVALPRVVGARRCVLRGGGRLRLVQVLTVFPWNGTSLLGLLCTSERVVWLFGRYFGLLCVLDVSENTKMLRPV